MAELRDPKEVREELKRLAEAHEKVAAFWSFGNLRGTIGIREGNEWYSIIGEDAAMITFYDYEVRSIEPREESIPRLPVIWLRL